MNQTRPPICLPDLDFVDSDDPMEVARAGAAAWEDALLTLIGYGERLESHVRNAEATRAIAADEPYVAAGESASVALAARAMGALGTSFELSRAMREALKAL